MAVEPSIRTKGNGQRGNTMSIKTLVVSLCVLLLLGCSEQREPEAPIQGPNSAYRSIGVVAPEHYDVWVDKFFIESLSEKDRKSTRLNSSHVRISYAVFCLKKKKKKIKQIKQ